ncbi:MAG: tetratricopeptide repeat protein [bacterium]
MKALDKSNILTNTVWIVLAVTFMVLPFVPDEKLIRLKLAWLEMGVFTACAVWIVWCGLTARLELNISKIFVPIMLYALYFAVLYYVSDNKHVSLMELRRAVLCMGIFFVVSQHITGVSLQKKLLGPWLISAGIIAVYGILQHTGGIGIISVPKMDRIMGTFGNPIFFAAHLLLTLPIIASWYVISKSRVIKISLVSLSIIMLTALFLTQTRASFIAVAAGTVIWIILKDSISNWKIFTIVSAKKWLLTGVVVVIILFHMVLVHMQPAYKHMNSTVVSYARYMLMRQQAHAVIWRDTLSMWKSSPVFGRGLGTFHIYFPEYASEKLKKIWPQHKYIINDAHNEYLQILAESGIVGFSLFWWIIGAYLWIIWKRICSGSNQSTNYEERIWVLGIGVSACMLLVQNMFSVDMRFVISSAMLFMLIGLGVSGSQKMVHLDWRRHTAGRWMLCICLVGMVFITGKSVVEPYMAERALLAEPDFFEKKILEPAKTLEDLHQLAKQYPDNSAVFEKLGWVYAKEKNWEDALKNYKKAVEINPQLSGGYNNLGNIYFTLGQRAYAMTYYTRALEIDPQLIDAQMNLGICYYYEGRLQESAECMKKVIELDPGNAKARDILKRMVE